MGPPEMSLSPQAKSVIDRLLSGAAVKSASENICIGPLDATTKTVLQIVVDSQSDLAGRTGADQASRLRQLYEAAKGSTERCDSQGSSKSDDGTDDSTVDDSAAGAGTMPAAAKWQLWTISCRSVRGVAPAGEDFSFPFDGQSTLIFGQNGSGKSSLLGAVVWVLAGRVILDSDEQVDAVPVYRIPGDADRGGKICDWPVAVTLPTQIEPSGLNATCVAEIELRSLDGEKLWIRRTSPNLLESSTDRSNWHRCSDLAHCGIAPLDVQLSLLAPTVFGQLAVEQAPHTRRLLSLMLGFDDLLDELESPLDKLKALSKYAASEVLQIFEPVRKRTIENLKKLYPECPSGLMPARLHIGKGKDKSVESLLSSGKCEVPGKFFANASLQRAIALSFFFALVEQHPRGLGFLVMDDPLLSLDEEHRESWSSSILCPCMDNLQVVVATHQRQYLNHNRHHFQKGKVVELNPRVRAGKISWRPGNRLERAALELQRAPTNAPNELRKYREELLITLDAYSTQPFLDSNLSDSFRRYRQFSAPHPLASSAQAKIVERLTKAEVTRVLDPGSHAMTEGDVTPAMIQQCLDALHSCDSTFCDELERLERLRKHTLRRSSIPAACIPFPSIVAQATWTVPIKLQLLGSAAARPESLTVIPDGDSSASEIPPAHAVLVSGATLDPVAKVGQWVLLAHGEGKLHDGDLAAVSTDGGRRYLRRVWSEGDNWMLQSINPVTPVASILLRKLHAAARRVIGVLYEPSTRPGSTVDEWQPRSDFDTAKLSKLRVITVEGDSLEPIAKPRQRVLVKEKLLPLDSIRRGSLAVIETSDDEVGCVIKRVFPAPQKWTLISSNPVEPHDPIVLPIEKIEAVWPLHGVLFEMYDLS